MVCTIADIARIMESWAPRELSEPGDNGGLLAGVATRPVQSVLISLDVTEAVIQYAAQAGAQLVVSHHPAIYRPISAVTDGSVAGKLALMAIERGVALYAAHTNLDRAAGGVNDALCAALGLQDAAPASPGSIGRIASLPATTSLDDFAGRARLALNAPMARVTGPGERPIQRLYVVSGAGRHDIADAVRAGADCMLTGEIGHHDGIDALELGLTVVELGHYHTEWPVLQHIEKHLQSQFQRLQYTVRTEVCPIHTSPFRFVL